MDRRTKSKTEGAPKADRAPKGRAGNGDAQAHLHIGNAAFRDGKIEEAIVHLRQASELDPTSTEARIALLRAATHSEDRAAAVAIAERNDFDAADPKVLALVAKAYRRNREFQREVAVWRRLAEQRPDDATPLIEAGEALIRAKDFDGALDCVSAAAARDPQSERAKLLRIQLVEKSGGGSAAMGDAIRDLASVNAAAALDHLPALISGAMYDVIADVLAQSKRQGTPIDPVLLSSLTRTLLTVARRADAEQRHEEAGRFWKAVLDIDPQNTLAAGGMRASIGSLLGQAREAGQNGDQEEAGRLFALVAAIDGQNTKSLYNLGSALEKLGWWREAAETWLRLGAVGADGDRPAAALRLAKGARKLESRDEQLAMMIKAREIDPNGEEIRDWGERAAARSVKEARAEAEAGRLREAVDNLVTALRWDKDSPKTTSTHRKLVSALKSRMQEAKAAEDAEATIDNARLLLMIDPDHLSAMKLVARNAYEQRRFDEAAALYSRLIELDPADERFYLRLGRIYRTLRIFDKGVPVIARLLEINPDHPEGKQLLLEMS